MSALVRILAWILALALVSLPVVALVNGWIGADRWPLRTLRVQGDLERVDAQRVRATVLPYARSGFFAVRLADARVAVAKLPWVERAEVHKRWPDVLEVRIVEHRPFALWGRHRLLSQGGRLFPRKGVVAPKGLPQLDGPDARVAEVVALYNESRTLFAADGLVVRRLALDARGSWSLALSNGTDVTVGSGEARLRLARFSRLMPQLTANPDRRIAHADLRYTNGFALTWREVAKAGMGNGERGMEAASSPRRRVASMPSSDANRRMPRAPTASIPHSPFPIPASSSSPSPLPASPTT